MERLVPVQHLLGLNVDINLVIDAIKRLDFSPVAIASLSSLTHLRRSFDVPPT
jgi:hypothetical protein